MCCCYGSWQRFVQIDLGDMNAEKYLSGHIHPPSADKPARKQEEQSQEMSRVNVPINTTLGRY